MRVRNFFISSTSISVDGGSENIPDTASSFIDPTVSDGDSLVSFLTLSGSTLGSPPDPYGDVNVYAKSGRSISSGQITGIQFGKSNVTPGTTDKADLIVIAAR